MSGGIEDSYFLKQELLFVVGDSRFLVVESSMGIGEMFF